MTVLFRFKAIRSVECLSSVIADKIKLNIVLAPVLVQSASIQLDHISEASYGTLCT